MIVSVKKYPSGAPWANRRNVTGMRTTSFRCQFLCLRESLQASETVCGVARRHGVSPSLLFKWRRQARRGRLASIPEKSLPSFVARTAPPSTAALGVIKKFDREVGYLLHPQSMASRRHSEKP